MTRYFLGIDIGGSKSHALIADDQGQAIGFGACGPGSYEVVGWDAMQEALHTISTQALTSAKIDKSQIAGAGFGIAGYDWPREREPHLEAIASLGITAPYALVNDTLIGLIAGTTARWGIGVVAGTGCNCWGRDQQGNEGRVTGCGAWFGEYGGAGDIVNRALQAIGRAYTLRGLDTRLTEAFIAETGARDVADMLEGLYLAHYELSARHAPLVFQVAAEGDEVAQDVICWAGRELGSLAIGVIRQLHFENLDFEVVQIGSLFNGGPQLGTSMLATIHKVAPGAQLVRLSTPPVVGGVLLGMEQAALDTPSLRPTLIESTQSLLKAVHSRDA